MRMRAQVREVAAEAIARARRGEGPTLIEAETYRFRGHSLADPDELRKKEEKEHYLVRPAAHSAASVHIPRCAPLPVPAVCPCMLDRPCAGRPCAGRRSALYVQAHRLKCAQARSSSKYSTVLSDARVALRADGGTTLRLLWTGGM